MKKNINLKIISVVLIIGIFSVSLIKQVVVLRRIKKEISTQTQELEQLKEKNITDPKEIDKYITNQKNLQKPIVTGEDIIITPVQFNEGDVRLIILGNDGKDDGQNAKIIVVG